MSEYPAEKTDCIQALVKIIQENHGSIPEHERPRAMELANRIDEALRKKGSG